MTDAVEAERWITILGGVVAIVSTFLMSKVGGREGERASSEVDEPAAIGKAVGAAFLDKKTAVDTIDLLTSIDGSLKQLVEVTEGRAERAMRDGIHEDTRRETDALQKAIRELQASIANRTADSRSTIRVRSPPHLEQD